MERHRYEIAYGSIDEIAERYYCAMPGMSPEGMETGKHYCRDQYVRGITVTYDREDMKNGRCALEAGTLNADQFSFCCSEMAGIDPGGLLGARFYLLTGDDVESGEDLLEDYYIHMWQTAYMDAARELVKNSLYGDCTLWVKEKKIQISYSFGPGFYGMDTAETEKFHGLLGGNEIGVSLCGQMLKPVKSCTGVYLAVEEGKYKSLLPCSSCQFGGNCELCSVGKQSNHS